MTADVWRTERAQQTGIRRGPLKASDVPDQISPVCTALSRAGEMDQNAPRPREAHRRTARTSRGAHAPPQAGATSPRPGGADSI